MGRKGFTLVEALLGLCLLGIISVTVLPIVTSSLNNLSKNKIKMEMNYMGEMAIERIKSYNEESSRELYIFDEKVSRVIDLFRSPGPNEIDISGKGESGNYLMKIIKDQRSNVLWDISVYVYHDEEGSNLSHVEYKTYFVQK